MNTCIETNPVHYFTVNNLDDPQAITMTALRKLEYLFWKSGLPTGDTDRELGISTLTISTGHSRQHVDNLILAFAQLKELPKVEGLQEELFHLNPPRLIAIATALFGLKPEHLEIVDEHLAEYLTPKAPNQTLPTTRAIANKIAAIRDMLNNPKASSISSKKDFGTNKNPDGTTDIYANVDSVEGKLIGEAVKRHSAATGKSQGEAFTDLILGNIKATIVLNLYTARDLAQAPVWASGIGWLDEETGHHWVDRATRTQDMDTVIGKHLDGHDPSPDLRAAVEGRDGGCSSPYCGVSAPNCDLDHRINHGDGGCTCTDNLHCWCRHHHNGKTCGRMKYLSDALTGITITVFEDGTWAVTVPEGPLTPQSARCAQTVSQYRSAHRKRWAAAAKREMDSTPPEEDTPPPF